MSSRHGIVSRLKHKKIHEVIFSGKRMDGRELEDYREIIWRFLHMAPHQGLGICRTF